MEAVKDEKGKERERENENEIDNERVSEQNMMIENI